MKLLREDKFLEELNEIRMKENDNPYFHYDEVEEILSKHTHDLPKEKESIGGNPKTAIMKMGELNGYNQCLEDCKKL
ncbi:hypothetical protein LCGC14_1408470 [marine sediment metagenome]|uniref:Uncharacterized protein n=1 Tax=marine sediment metagenome TaxID=412755 RepID=A0A0F9MWM0_9ZZZZ